jgi:23S rRNA pseudouridine1911/1915/1917 synthase
VPIPPPENDDIAFEEEGEPGMRADVPMASAGERIDRVAAQLFPVYSRARLQAWIDEGRLAVDGVVAHAKTRLLGGEVFELTPDLDPAQTAFSPEPVDFEVVHEAEQFIVVNKPVGLVVHPAAGNWSGTLLNGLLHRYPELGNVPRAGIVHRLDKDTTGLMVVARSLTAQTDLVRQLQARSVSRRYWAVCWGKPMLTVADGPIGRDPRERTRMAVVGSGKPSLTHVQTLTTGRILERDISLVECRLETGRTHQIRVHLAHAGHQLVGDALYAARNLGKRNTLVAEATGFNRQALHAFALSFDLAGDSASGATPTRVHYTCELPPDMAGLLHHAGIAAPEAACATQAARE